MTKSLRESSEHFYTYDMGLSAALASLDFVLIDLDKSNPRKVRFVFEKTAELDEAVRLFWSDDLSVRARSMFENLKMLKNRLYSTD